MAQPPPNLPEQPPPSQLPVPHSEEPTATRLMWGFAGAGGCLLVLLAVVFFSALAVAGTLNGGVRLMTSSLSNIFNPAPPAASITSSQTIVNRIQPLGQLVSTSAQVAKADIEVSIQQGAFSMCNHQANHVASATIEAGVDLYTIDTDAISYNAVTDTYTLRVPRPSITSCYIDFIDQYNRQRSGPTCTVDWDDARQLAQYEALVAFRQEAVEGGLLVSAERDTRQALTSFITALTGSNVIIEFTDTTNVDASCNPAPPQNWQQEAGAWIRVN